MWLYKFSIRYYNGTQRLPGAFSGVTHELRQATLNFLSRNSSRFEDGLEEYSIKFFSNFSFDEVMQIVVRELLYWRNVNYENINLDLCTLIDQQKLNFYKNHAVTLNKLEMKKYEESLQKFIKMSGINLDFWQSYRSLKQFMISLSHLLNTHRKF